MYGSWFVLYEFFLKPDGRFDHIITVHITEGICSLLSLSGYDPYYSIALKLGETYIYLNGSPVPVIRVGASCNGLELLALFTIFVLCYPGNWKVKIPYLLAGITIIHLLNIVRNYILTLMAIHKSPWYDLFHRYILLFAVYGTIFFLWILWANKYSHLTFKRATTE
jgi:exosortase family protein XrtF